MSTRVTENCDFDRPVIFEILSIDSRPRDISKNRDLMDGFRFARDLLDQEAGVEALSKLTICLHLIPM